jgi:hypothetical protein
MSSGDKNKQASYDSAADSDIELDMEQKGAPAAKVCLTIPAAALRCFRD